MHSTSLQSSFRASLTPGVFSARRDMAHTSITRRGVVLGGAALLGSVAGGLGPALASTSERRFEIYRGATNIGFQSLRASRNGPDLRVRVEVALAVRFLGIVAYRYEHTNQEVWRDGRLVSIDAKTNDDGDKAYCRVRREGDAFEIDGSSFRGRAPLTVAPTSYWNYANFETDTWISTQSGELLSVAFDASRMSGGLERRVVSGDFDITLYYDARREWRSAEFDGKGETIRYVETAPGPEFLALI